MRMDKLFTAADLKKIKQALFDIGGSQPLLDLLKRIEEDVAELEALRENAKKNLVAFQEFIESMK